MQTNRIGAIVGGAVLFIIGLILGAAISGGPSVEEIDAAVGKRIDAASATQTEAIGKVGAGLTQLSGDIGGKIDGIAASGSKAAADVAALGTTLQGAIEKSGADQIAALTSGLAGLRGQISAAPAAAPASSSAAEAPAAAAAPVDGIGPGETAILSDGALSVFLSRIDEAAGAANVRANGQDIVLAAGQPQTVAGPGGDCQVTLDAFGGNRAAISGACGDALPPPDGVAPGTAVDLAEGLRVFVSAVDENGARIAVNGVQTVDVAVGQGVTAQSGDKSCTVTVERIDRGRVALGYTCG